MPFWRRAVKELALYISIMNYREHLIHWRQKRALTQTDLAAGLGIHKSVLSRIERGERGLDIELAQSWARALGLELLLLYDAHLAIISFMAEMKTEDVELLRQLAGLIPRLNSSDRRTLWGLLEVWQRSYPSTEAGLAKAE